RRSGAGPLGCGAYSKRQRQIFLLLILLLLLIVSGNYRNIYFYEIFNRKPQAAAAAAIGFHCGGKCPHFCPDSPTTRLFGVTGNCAACSKLIPAFEMVMRAKENVYHLDCFACQLCNQRFCVGDKFFLKNNMILCQTDYEEGLMKEGYSAQVR
uniref:LIM domain only protein 3 n=1 Tax=Xenopus tropicalis TaxID=8364 RepID=A0A803JXZ2_XENTR